VAAIGDVATSFPERPLPRSANEPDPRVPAALRGAASAERKTHGSACPPRRRIAFLICELGMRLGPEAVIALDRTAIAEALDLSLCRVKRVLGLFQLSGDLEYDGRRIRVSDWRRLCTCAGYDQAGLVADLDEEQPARAQAEDPILTTGSGEPAFFG
jgi:hypothetical protein